MPKPRGGVRVIAGSARGRRLDTPPGSGTRPITDRVKESLFGHLDPRLPGARVLDLYAGSGAMAIEALSRGAVEAVLVERDAGALTVIEANLTRVGFDDRARAVRAEVTAYVGRPAPGVAFDLVFVDPPFDLPTEEVERVLAALASGWLAPGASVVVRRHRKSRVPEPPDGLEFPRVKAYGDTVVLVATAT
ncbi:MAG: 16S rRNA (guanine(966)-N(2))-methyltransferase RsmD [Actinobacteria bacterium]|nr:16S rRNA (guanine(966)-N(2))-methyltransferase RsmD [Actinomycetota bacterium]